MAGAKITLEDAPPQHVHHVSYGNGFRGPRQGVAAILAAGRFHEAALPQRTQNLRGISWRHALRLADFGNSEAAANAGIPDPDQAAQSVLFVRAQLHLRNLISAISQSE